MTKTLVFRNRQRRRVLNTPLLRRLTLHLLRQELAAANYELCIHFVTASEMARVNWQFLQHEGSTDVITFDHSGIQSFSEETKILHGEIFISIPDAVTQARGFGTDWKAEVARYIIHGLLHLRGYDDLNPVKRRVMKREENRLLKALAKNFPLRELAHGRSSKLKIRNRE